MKKITLLLIPILLFSCSKNAAITDIVIDPNPPSTADTINCIALTESMTNKGGFDWEITSEDGNEIEIIESENNFMQWSTDYTGFYTVKVKHGIGKKATTYSKEIEVSNSTTNYYKSAFRGKWTGTGDTPAGWAVDIIDLNIEFFEDGGYSAQGSSDSPAFYYGSDDDNPGKKIIITEVKDNGAAGNLIIYFSSGGGGSLFIDTVNEINFSNANNTLKFNYYRTSTGDNYGPIEYSLQRVE
ncbi:MAG: hypothetical protein GQ574_09605 [Crocinitomix sp.]|nr:hypothetical protein [Crocinitomix sp.]